MKQKKGSVIEKTGQWNSGERNSYPDPENTKQDESKKSHTKTCILYYI